MVQISPHDAFDRPTNIFLLPENALTKNTRSQLTVVTLHIHLIFYSCCSLFFVWSIGYWRWAMGYGLWAIGYGVLDMGDWLWVIGYGRLAMGYWLWAMGDW